MSTSANPWQSIFDTLTKLRGGWPSSEWTWDPRFECLTSSFDSADVPRARSVLDTAVPVEWSSTTIADAPEAVSALAKRCGGLRPGQLLRSGDDVAGLLLFALWWPWGDGSKVSVRFGITGADRPKEMSPQLRALYGV
jgi:hypothetical protein